MPTSVWAAATPTGDHSASGETGEEQRESVGYIGMRFLSVKLYYHKLRLFKWQVVYCKQYFIPSSGAEIQHLQSEISRLENPTDPIEVRN